jgi:hypothetical protein
MDLIGEPTIIERFYYGEFVAEAVTGPDEKRGPVKTPNSPTSCCRPSSTPRASARPSPGQGF